MKIPPVTVSCASQTIPLLCDRTDECEMVLANFVLDEPIRSPRATGKPRTPPMPTTHGEELELVADDVPTVAGLSCAVHDATTPASSNIAMAPPQVVLP